MKQLKIKVNGKEYMVEVEEVNVGSSSSVLTQSVSPTTKDFGPIKENTKKVENDKRIIATQKENPKKENKKSFKPEEKTTPAKTSEQGEEIKAPMPGKILKINVSEGDKVNEGDTVLILEAMKMENEIMANASGTVKKISVSVNDMVDTDDSLLIIE